MTEWQWKVVMALVRYVLSLKYDWVEYREQDEAILVDAVNREN